MFPARAGMSRLERMGGHDEYDVPRASGDEPVSGVITQFFRTCSPRERG